MLIFLAESCPSAGTSFIIGFFRNVLNEGFPYVYGTVSEPSYVTINVPRYNFKQTLYVTRFIYVSIADDLGGTNRETSNRGIEVTSTSPISLYMHHSRINSGEGTVILPESCANNEYMIIAHDSSSLEGDGQAVAESITLALEDGTSVQVQNPANGETLTRTLNRFDLFHYSNPSIEGAKVTADKNVVVFAGHRCANIPDASTGRCDYIIEQIPPVASLRRAYIITYQKPRPKFSVRVAAPFKNTTVFFWNANGTLALSVELDSTEEHFETFTDSKTISVTADKDILVGQYAHGMDSDGSSIGDPSYVIMPSVNQYLSDYNIAIDTRLYSRHFLALILRGDDDESGLRLNSLPLGATTYETVTVPGVGDFKVIHEEVIGITNPAINVPLIHLNGTVQFGAMQYGFMDRLGYALMAGRDTPSY